MAYTQSQIDALKTAIASGVLIVTHGETTTHYRNLREMKAILSDMESEVNSRPRRTVARFTNGA